MNKSKFPVKSTIFALFLILADVNTSIGPVQLRSKNISSTSMTPNLKQLNPISRAIARHSNAERQLTKISEEIKRDDISSERHKALIKETINVFRELNISERELSGELFNSRSRVLKELEKYHIKTDGLLDKDGKLIKPISIEFQPSGVSYRIRTMLRGKEDLIQAEDKEDGTHIKIKGEQEELKEVLKRINSLPKEENLSMLDSYLQQNFNNFSKLLNKWQKLVSKHINNGQFKNSQGTILTAEEALEKALTPYTPEGFKFAEIDSDTLKKVLKSTNTTLSFEDSEIELLAKYITEMHNINNNRKGEYQQTQLNHAVSVSRILNNISEELPLDSDVPNRTFKYFP